MSTEVAPESVYQLKPAFKKKQNLVCGSTVIRPQSAMVNATLSQRLNQHNKQRLGLSQSLSRLSATLNH